MKDRQPWSVRGVTREARAKAARAASHQHMTIGEWVTQTLIAAADRDLGLASEPAQETAAATANLPARPAEQQRELTQALGALVRYLESSAQSGDVARRLERTEHVLMGRIEQMAAGLYSLMQTMETRTMPVVDADSGTTRLMLPDQSRLADAVEKIADAEARRQDQMTAVAEALTLLAARVGDPAAPLAAVEAPAAEAAAGEDEADDDATASDMPCEPEPEDDGEPLVLSDEVIETDDDGEDVVTIDETAEESGDTGVTDDGHRSDDDAEDARNSLAAATAAWMADGRDAGEDVVASIRARRLSDQDAEDEAAKRGFLGRLFRRD